MTNAYSAWSEFDPAVAAELRYAIQTGDWAGFDQEVTDAFQQALRHGNWESFTPDTARAIRAAVGQEQLKAEQERTQAEVKADRELAAEMRQLGAKYSDFGTNAQDILRYALKGPIADLDTAYKAWRSANGHDGPALVGQPSTSTNAPIERFRQIQALLADGKTTGDERRRLKWEMDDLRDAHGPAIGKAAQAADQGPKSVHTAEEHEAWRADRIHDANESNRIHNAQRTAYIASGRVDKSPRVSKEEKRALMDLEADDLASGRKAIPTPKRKSPTERAADNAGLDDLDRKALALMRGETIGEPEISQPNAEAVLQENT